MKTLPYTPVVSYYDEEKDDFVGHATEQQIYGIVDPKVEPSFEVDTDGNTWCVCDVVLYTERPDKLGTIAQKIVGHKQSLELDPHSAEYVINYDEHKHFKNIEFTAGKFVGVSVLGNDQEPAFTGSEFFAYNAEFERKMQILREYCESKEDPHIQGGNTMNYSEFIKLSWGEAAELIMSAIAKAYQNDAYVNLIDMYDDSVIVQFYYFIEQANKLMRVGYEISDNGDVKLGKVNEVRVVYEDINPIPTITSEDLPAQDNEQNSEVEAPKVETHEEPPMVTEPVIEPIAETEPEHPVEKVIEVTPAVEIIIREEQSAPEQSSAVEKYSEDSSISSEEKQSVEEVKSEEPETSVSNEEVVTDENVVEQLSYPDEEEDKKEDDKEKDEEDSFEEDPAPSSVVDTTPILEKVSVENGEITEETSSSTSFAESERAEFETLKREKKETLIHSYKEDLSEDEYNNFLNTIDSFETYESLELALLKAYKNNKYTKVMRAFAFAPQTNNAKSDTLDGFVRKNLR